MLISVSPKLFYHSFLLTEINQQKMAYNKAQNIHTSNETRTRAPPLAAGLVTACSNLLHHTSLCSIEPVFLIHNFRRFFLGGGGGKSPPSPPPPPPVSVSFRYGGYFTPAERSATTPTDQRPHTNETFAAEIISPKSVSTATSGAATIEQTRQSGCTPCSNLIDGDQST